MVDARHRSKAARCLSHTYVELQKVSRDTNNCPFAPANPATHFVLYHENLTLKAGLFQSLLWKRAIVITARRDVQCPFAGIYTTSCHFFSITTTPYESSEHQQ